MTPKQLYAVRCRELWRNTLLHQGKVACLRRSFPLRQFPHCLREHVLLSFQYTLHNKLHVAWTKVPGGQKCLADQSGPGWAAGLTLRFPFPSSSPSQLHLVTSIQSSTPQYQSSRLPQLVAVLSHSCLRCFRPPPPLPASTAGKACP